MLASLLLAAATSASAEVPCMSAYASTGELVPIVQLNFENATIIHSNLGGQGGRDDALLPSGTMGQNIRLGNVGKMVDGTVIDLVITNSTECEANPPRCAMPALPRRPARQRRTPAASTARATLPALVADGHGRAASSLPPQTLPSDHRSTDSRSRRMAPSVSSISALATKAILAMRSTTPPSHRTRRSSS